MNRPFSTIAVLLLLAIGALHAARLLLGWPVLVAGVDIPASVSVAGLGIALALAIGLWFEARMHARLAEAAEMPDPVPEPSRSVGPATRAPGKKFTVRKGRRYRAQIVLGFLEQMASNDTIAGMFRDVGFEDVVVAGSGGRRTAEGMWSGEDSTAEMPSQIVSAIEVETAFASLQTAAPGGEAAIQRSRSGPKRFTVRKGQRYRAQIVLGFFEQVASNETIARMLADAGFEEVEVTGTGGRRVAIALWPGEDTTAAMPAQIASAEEIASPPATTVAASPGTPPAAGDTG